MSSAKHFTEVLIGGKVYTLSGFEGEEYLQKVSSYLNHKITECANSEGYRKQSADTRNVLLALNIADDYFKAKKQGDSLENDIELKDKEMYDLKHELISAQIKLENAEKELAKMKEENNDLQMQIVRDEEPQKMIIKAVIFDSLFLYYDPERNRYHLCQTERSKSLPRRDPIMHSRRRSMQVRTPCMQAAAVLEPGRSQTILRKKR